MGHVPGLGPPPSYAAGLPSSRGPGRRVMPDIMWLNLMSNGIDSQITAALSRTPLSTGDNLDGFEIDVDYYSSALGLLDDFSVT